MKAKTLLKKEAIRLRKLGYSYSEILKTVSVSRSSLSLWLRTITLSPKQVSRLTSKKVNYFLLGGKARREIRIRQTKEIVNNAKREILSINNDILRVIGSTLYWAEGSKQKEKNISQGIIFANSDYLMIRLFIKWAKECLSVKDSDFKFEIYIHDSKKKEVNNIRTFWSDRTGFPLGMFGKIYFKKANPKTQRRNIGSSYFGLLRVKVSKSTNLNRKVSGWIEGICNQCGVV